MDDPANFGDLPKAYSDRQKAAITVLPVAYDKTSTWMKGSDKGPAAIVAASANMELYDIETDSEVYKNGIFTAESTITDAEPSEMIETVERTVGGFIGEDKFVVVLGGEHSVSIGSVRAHVEKYPDLTVLQLDAHADLRNEYNGSKYNHACVMARVRELCPLVQVGVRSMDVSEKEFLDEQRMFFAIDLCNSRTWIDDVVSELSSQVYVTLDLDVFDPSIMPSTGTPEPGGLFWYDVLELLKAVCAGSDVVGFDVVELCPDERNKAPDFLAANLIYKLLSYKFKG